MTTLFHLANPRDWTSTADYYHRSLEADGFIHLARPHQVTAVANQIFPAQNEVLLLQISEERLTAPVKFEKSETDFYPHVYGPINRDAVVATYLLARGPGGFSLPQSMALIDTTLMRPGETGDEYELANCRAFSWLESYRGMMPNAVLDDLPLKFRLAAQSTRRALADKASHGIFVAENVDHGIVGFCVVGSARDQDMRAWGELKSIHILAKYKRKGFGRFLLEMGLNRLKSLSYGSAYLWVMKANDPAIAFYQACGGKVLDIEKRTHLDLDLPHIAIGWDFTGSQSKI